MTGPSRSKHDITRGCTEDELASLSLLPRSMQGQLTASSRIEPERRASQRVRVDLGATMHKDATFHTCRIADVSEGGLLLTTTACSLEPGRAIAVAFPVDGEVIMVRGEIRWARGALAGIAFSYVSPFDRAMIKAFCRKSVVAS